jgi:hypothetical protein
MLVVGSAPCLYDDVDRALQLRPFAALMLVNGACTALENAEHVLAGHEEKAEFYARERRARFPNAPLWKLHACSHPHRLATAKQLFPSVTDWHPHEIGVGATSASKAAKLAFLLGATEVILCGCPMDQPGYFAGEAQVPQHVNCQRIGDHGIAKGLGIPVQQTRIVQAYRTRFKELAAGEFKGKVFSMSGYTRDCLGEPPAETEEMLVRRKRELELTAGGFKGKTWNPSGYWPKR